MELYSILGILGAVYLVYIMIWFCSRPISRDQLLVKYGWKYFLRVIGIMLSCAALIAWLSDAQWLQPVYIESPLWESLQYCIKMKEPKDGDLHVLPFIFIMLFQLVIFEGLVLASIIGWTSRRAKRYLNGEVRYWRFAFGKNFAVVIGANEVAPSVIKNLLEQEYRKKNSLNYTHEKENKYVILQTSSDVDEVRKILKSYLTPEEYNRVIIYRDLRNSYEGLQALHLEEASEIYVLGENTTVDGGETFHDTMNMRCVNMMANILGNRFEDEKVCKVLFEYQTTFSILQFSDVPNEVNQAMHFIPFNRYESWARRVMVDNKAMVLVDENDKMGQDKNEHKNQVDYTPLDGPEGIKYEDSKRVHFIVVGMSKMGVAMGTQALFQAHYPNYVRDNSLKSRITFIDANAKQEMDFFKGRYATLFELARHRYIDANKCPTSELNSDYAWVDPAAQSDYKWKHLSEGGHNFLDVEIEFVKGELESDGVREYLRQVTADQQSKVTIAICLPLTHQAVAAALYMPLEVYDKVQEIWVYQREAADIITNLEHARETNLRYKKLRPFGMLYGEYIDSRTHYLKALLVNSIYDMDGEKYNKEKLDMGEPDTYKGLRDSWNDLSVAQQWSNMYFADSMYQKLRCTSGDMSCIGHLARCEHNRWNVQQLLMGFAPADTATLKEFAQLETNKKTQVAADARKKWKDNVGWNNMTEPLEQKRAKEHDLYKQSPHGQYDEKKNELKHGPCHIHPNIIHYDLLDVYDSGAKDYDEKLNNGIPTIIELVDDYKKKDK